MTILTIHTAIDAIRVWLGVLRKRKDVRATSQRIGWYITEKDTESIALKFRLPRKMKHVLPDQIK